MQVDLIENKAKATYGFQRELEWIDSLENARLISEEIKAFYTAKNRLAQKKLETYAIESMEINTQLAVNTILEIDNSELANSVYLDEFSELIITNQTQMESNALIDSLITEAQLSPNEKPFLFHYLKKEVPYLSFKEADEVLGRYEDKLANPAQLIHLNSFNKTLQGIDPTIELMGMQNSFSDFKELLDQKRGKYLYVDLWAAWCIPCIKAFPASLALNETYKSKGLEVIFLSVDDNYKFWEEVANKYEIAIPDQSFVAIKKDESEYLKALNVAQIPRCLIFDPEGKLIHPNAPRPDTEEIKLFFDAILGN
ncbi:TlpA disulfide reductase family protein [Algoriphagus sp. NG3]|uniref:TlpA family protein disulfide reductase n=1 Tax=Algoriphagus sp. NG3 TaxID=3097546 RepID=UPI002A801BAE|nr:TlpA disulfide reductase family protein [Algoriphagus sp. NG3]WPR76909.1 TlpA disulfide reductase family protein [Algoriphagus sp. NG3]